MKNLLGIDSDFSRFMAMVLDMIVLNIIFIVTSLPLVTIGPGLSALYHTTLKICKKEDDSSNFIYYFKTFKENLKQSTLSWLVIMIFVIIVYFDSYLIAISPGNNLLMRVILQIAMIIAIVLQAYLYHLIPLFNNTLKNHLKNAFILSIRNILHTIFILLICTLPTLIGLQLSIESLIVYLIFYLLIGFSVTAYFISRAMNNILKKVNS